MTQWNAQQTGTTTAQGETETGPTSDETNQGGKDTHDRDSSKLNASSSTPMPVTASFDAQVSCLQYV